MHLSASHRRSLLRLCIVLLYIHEKPIWVWVLSLWLFEWIPAIQSRYRTDGFKDPLKVKSAPWHQHWQLLKCPRCTSVRLAGQFLFLLMLKKHDRTLWVKAACHPCCLQDVSFGSNELKPHLNTLNMYKTREREREREGAFTPFRTRLFLIKGVKFLSVKLNKIRTVKYRFLPETWRCKKVDVLILLHLSLSNIFLNI